MHSRRSVPGLRCEHATTKTCFRNESLDKKYHNSFENQRLFYKTVLEHVFDVACHSSLTYKHNTQNKRAKPEPNCRNSKTWILLKSKIQLVLWAYDKVRNISQF